MGLYDWERPALRRPARRRSEAALCHFTACQRSHRFFSSVWLVRLEGTERCRRRQRDSKSEGGAAPTADGVEGLRGPNSGRATLVGVAICFARAGGVDRMGIGGRRCIGPPVAESHFSLTRGLLFSCSVCHARRSCRRKLRRSDYVKRSARGVCGAEGGLGTRHKTLPVRPAARVCLEGKGGPAGGARRSSDCGEGVCEGIVAG